MEKKTDYRVLARKYRPVAFKDLIGQEVMVRTLANSLLSGRISHAFLLTGVRGVGKTTTARIIARALNCESQGAKTLSTAEPCGTCEHCKAMDEGNHVDVLEIDAASHTGVANIREIIENVRYRPVSARYKVYVIDEVHMLSIAAFNALLKTLEEPPEHVIFVLATTEVRKVPVTVISRCQRFDLRRIEEGQLVDHLKAISKKENVDIEERGVALIAKASEGSVRDGLSLLDQAISFSGDSVSEDQVRRMLGLGDRTKVIQMFHAMMGGDLVTALQIAQDRYDLGADPILIVQELMEFCHWLTRLKVTKSAERDLSMSEEEQNSGREMIEKLNMSELTRTWLFLIKGLKEVQSAPAPFAALEMLLIRVAFSSDLPDPANLVRSLASQENNNSTQRQAAQTGKTNSDAVKAANDQPDAGGPDEKGSQAQTLETAELQETNIDINDFQDVIDLAEARAAYILRAHLISAVHIVSFEFGKIVLRLAASAPPQLVQQLCNLLAETTGVQWSVVSSAEAGEPTVRQQMEHAATKKITDAEQNPLVQRVLEEFPGSKIRHVKDIGPDEGAPETYNPQEERVNEES